jgi:hypothetical protein
MSPQLRSAWMPPAVAQAPMVMRKRLSARTRTTRRASSGVVMLPSTNAMSYGPRFCRLRASGK